MGFVTSGAIPQRQRSLDPFDIRTDIVAGSFFWIDYINDNGQAMFILGYLTLFAILFRCQTLGVFGASEVDDPDGGWGMFLSVSQGDEVQFPTYDIGHWTKQLHLQQCAFVEIGDEFCALFVELRSIPSTKRMLDSHGVSELFLGLCECATVRSWVLCSDQLMRRRKSDCIFTEAVPSANTSARVHRRLCDVTLLTEYAEPCNCSVQMANQQLYPTEESICSPRGVCGIAQCCVTTIEGIHSPQCDPECHEKQPFCEELGPWTSVPPQITSLWSHWSTPICQNSGGRIFSTATAICHNQVTGKPAIDCIGPGSFCCPVDTESCTCIVTNEGGIMKAIRMVESTLCLLDFKDDGPRNFKRANQMRKGIKKGIQRYRASDPLYHNTLGERMEYQSVSEYKDSFIPLRRRLMFLSYDYLEDRDRSFGRGAEFAGSENVAVNDEIEDDDDDEDEDDEPDDDPEEKENEEDGDVEAIDDGELAENGEDDAYNTESSEFDEYVRRARDPNTKMTGFGWASERLPRFARSNPSRSASHRKRQDEPESGSSGEGECDEPEDGSGIEGPLQYNDYEVDAPDQQGRGIGNDEEEDSSVVAIGQILRPHILCHLSIYICVALCI